MMETPKNLSTFIIIFAIISSPNVLRTDGSINTVEEFLDTLINSSRYDRRIRPFFDQQSLSISVPLTIVNQLCIVRFLEACNVTMTIHINTISAINEVNMVRHVQ